MRLNEKVKKMQRFFGFPPSGELNAETLAVMKKPRCGLSDVEQFGETFRWKNRIISYRSDIRSRGNVVKMQQCSQLDAKASKIIHQMQTF